MVFQDDYPWADIWLQGNEHHEGTVLLEEQRCGWAIHLVIAGPLAGTVWHSGDYGWLPHFYVDDAGECRPHDFLSWFDCQLGRLGA